MTRLTVLSGLYLLLVLSPIMEGGNTENNLELDLGSSSTNERAIDVIKYQPNTTSSLNPAPCADFCLNPIKVLQSKLFATTRCDLEYKLKDGNNLTLSTSSAGF